MSVNRGMKQLRISGGSPTKETAGSIVKCYFDSNIREIELRAVGASAVNQMFKAMATARGIFAQRGLDLTCRPGYDEVVLDGVKKTIMIAKIMIR